MTKDKLPKRLEKPFGNVIEEWKDGVFLDSKGRT